MQSIIKIVFIILALYLVGCSAKPIQIQTGLIQPYSAESNSLEKLTAPYVAIYKKGTFRLRFIAADHVENSENPTCRTIRKEFKEIMPGFLIVEGMPFTTINDPEQISYAKNCEINHYENCGEDACAINEALKGNVSFNYGEPADNAIKVAIVQSGYSEQDVLFFYALRQIPQWKRQGIIKTKALKSKLVESLPRYSRRLQTAAMLSLKDFEDFYLTKFKEPINYDAIDTETVSPRIDENPTWANKISHQIGVVREHFLAAMIEKRLNEFKDLIVVYGQGHLVKERKAFENAFGSSIDTKPF